MCVWNMPENSWKYDTEYNHLKCLHDGDPPARGASCTWREPIYQFQTVNEWSSLTCHAHQHLINLKCWFIFFRHEHGDSRFHEWSRKDANRVIPLPVAAISFPSRLPRKQRGLRRRRCLLPQGAHHRLVGFLVLCFWWLVTTQGVILQRIVHDRAQISERIIHRGGSCSVFPLRSYDRWLSWYIYCGTPSKCLGPGQDWSPCIKVPFPW